MAGTRVPSWCSGTAPISACGPGKRRSPDSNSCRVTLRQPLPGGRSAHTRPRKNTEEHRYGRHRHGKTATEEHGRTPRRKNTATEEHGRTRKKLSRATKDEGVDA